MSPGDVEAFCEYLEDNGLVYLLDGNCVDVSVVDQLRGPTMQCDWLEFGHVEIDGNRIAACRLVGSDDNDLITPDGWRYEGSLSATFGFVPNEHTDRALVFLRHEDGLDVYRSKLTGEEVYVARTGDKQVRSENRGKGSR